MNLSEQYHTLLNQSEPPLSIADIRDLANRYQVLFLKGFLGDLLPKRFDSYFFDQMRWLHEHRIRYRRLEPDSGFGTQKLPENNVDAIESAIRSGYENHPDQQILIVSHSKGGIDTLETLLRRKNLIDRKLAGWIAIQAPFWGTPVADWATQNRMFNPLIEQLLGSLFRGDKKVAARMTLDARKDYMTRHADAVLEIASTFNILNFASSSEPGDASMFRPLRFAIEKFAKVRNDGLLPTQSEILTVHGAPCCPYIETDHLDHIYAVLPMTPDKNLGPAAAHKERRIRIFTSLLKIWMDNCRPGPQ
jgi:hypothetical protein